MGQFLVETGDKCFICLEGLPLIKIDPTVVREGEGGPDKDDDDLPPGSRTFSFHNIFQYVKVDVSDIVPGTGGVVLEGSSNNNANNSSFRTPTLEGRLCLDCGQLSQQFSNQFRELEAIRMKLDICLRSIYDKMVGVNQERSSLDGLVDELRRRALEGCSRKLAIVSPQVTVEMLTDVTIPPEDLDLDVKVESDPDMDDTPQPDLIDTGPTSLRSPTPTPPNKLEDTTTEDSSSLMMECDLCHLKVMDLFTHHATVHTSSNLATTNLKLLEYECNLCGKKFAKNWALGRHKRRIHHVETMRDVPAGVVLGAPPPSQQSSGQPPQPVDAKPWKDSSNKVEGDATPSTGFQCVKCNRIFTGRPSLQMHQRNLNGCSGRGAVGGAQALVCSCQVCGRGFAKLSYLRHHFKTVHSDQLEVHVSQTTENPEETFILPDMAPAPAPSSPGEEDHPSAPAILPGGGSEGNYNCKFCPRQFFSRNGLARHLALAHLAKIATKVADTDKELTSDHRAYTTVYFSHSKTEVQRIIGDIHPDPLTNKYVCPRCDREFEGRRKGYVFRNHFKTEHLNVRYQCKICSKQFTRMDYCDAHYRDHHMAFQYSCNGCGTRFTKDKLGQHLWRGRCFS